MEQIKVTLGKLHKFIFLHKTISLIILCVIFLDLSLIGVIADAQKSQLKKPLQTTTHTNVTETPSSTPVLTPTKGIKKSLISYPTVQPTTTTVSQRQGTQTSNSVIVRHYTTDRQLVSLPGMKTTVTEQATNKSYAFSDAEWKSGKLSGSSFYFETQPISGYTITTTSCSSDADCAIWYTYPQDAVSGKFLVSGSPDKQITVIFIFRKNTDTSSTESTIKDTEAPHSTIFTPKEGEMTSYLQDGKPCAVMFAPTDNITPPNDIETDYKFDDGNWSGFAKAFDTSRAYLCGDFENGSSHTLFVRSRDKAGNIEEAQVRHFIAQRP